MFDIGWSELLIIAIVAVVVVGPRELPGMLRTFGKYVGQMRRMAGDFQRQLNDALKEAELDEVRKGIESVRSVNPLNQMKDSLNPLKSAGEDLRKAIEDPAAPKTAAAATAPAASAAGSAQASPPTGASPHPQPAPAAMAKAGSGKVAPSDAAGVAGSPAPKGAQAKPAAKASSKPAAMKTAAKPKEAPSAKNAATPAKAKPAPKPRAKSAKPADTGTAA
jgi:sec-independent protein translocase protein TatB